MMSSASKPVLATLYRSGTFHLPEFLTDVYRGQLASSGLLETATSGKEPQKLYGGQSLEETTQHFAHRFCTSAVRPEVLILDPGRVFQNIPDDLITTFSSGRLRLLDLGCGSGGGILGLLSTLHELRNNRLFFAPLPLTVSILAADFSQHAITFYKNMISDCEPTLRSSGIVLEIETKLWDAAKIQQTSALCDVFLSDSSANEYFVLVSAMSGSFRNISEDIKRSIQHVSERLSNQHSCILWIEPGSEDYGKGSGFGLIQRIVAMAKSWYWFSIEKPDDNWLHSTYRWFEPIKCRTVDRGSIAVMRLRQSDYDVTS